MPSLMLYQSMMLVLLLPNMMMEILQRTKLRNEDEINGIDIKESIMSIYLGAIEEQLTEQQYFQSYRTILTGITKIGAILIKPGSR